MAPPSVPSDAGGEPTSPAPQRGSAAPAFSGESGPASGPASASSRDPGSGSGSGGSGGFGASTGDASVAATGAAGGGPTARRAPEPASWSDAPPPPDTAPSWASPLEQAKAAVAVEAEVEAGPQHVVDDTAISDDDESIDDLTDVGVPVVERILGGTVIAEDSR